MAHTPKPERHKIKVVRMLERWGRKQGYTMHPPIWINGVPHVAFREPGPLKFDTTRFVKRKTNEQLLPD